jgi:hypothetical protein
MTHAIDLHGALGDLEAKRELLRLRFAVSRLRVQTALADLQGDAMHSAPARAMAWVRAPWVRRIAFAAAACLLIGTLWRFGWRRPVRWVAQGLSLWQLARPLLHDLGFGAGQASGAAEGVAAAAAGREAQPAAP